MDVKPKHRIVTHSTADTNSGDGANVISVKEFKKNVT